MKNIVIALLSIFTGVLFCVSTVNLSKSSHIELVSLISVANANPECDDDEKEASCDITCLDGSECTGTCCVEGTTDCTPDSSCCNE